MDLGIHCADLITYVTGSPAKKVFSFCDSLTHAYEVEDSALAVFQLENGTLCHVDAHFNIPDDAASCRFEVYGTSGSMFAEGTISQVEGGTLSVLCVPDDLSYDAKQQREPAVRLPVNAEFGNMYQKEIFSFGQSVLIGAPLEVPLEDTLRAQRIIELAYLSAKTGRMQTTD
jgi:predicted dehydrogenase